MSQQVCVNRLKKELLALSKNDDIKDIFIAKPSTSNILEWHFVIYGPPDTPYHGGYYHGMIIFPVEYPYKAPSILMITPSGRFNCNSRICTSMSDFHQDTWSPFWSNCTIILGLISFMTEDEVGFGSIVQSKETRKKLAAQSMAFNIKNPIFIKLFPELVSEYKKNGIYYSSSSSSSSSNISKRNTPTVTTTTLTKTLKDTSKKKEKQNNIIIFIIFIIISSLFYIYFK
ncbi:hypothetical protein RB653_000250 [Dictyostelium firmibasis]|uniref:UBC core domain-containing protein n=1 Tax=Dictyostelium firmibasis TaxID=79012 RepID=A0AAN7Z114_9MYCE